MAYQTPKTDWTPSDVPLSADVNRWELNTKAAYELACMLQISGSAIGVSDAFTGGEVRAVQSVYVAVDKTVDQDNPKELKVRFVSFNLSSNFKLRVQVEGEANYYESESNQGYYDAATNEAVNSVLYTNVDLGIDYKKLTISIVNVSGMSNTLVPSSGWLISISGTVRYIE